MPSADFNLNGGTSWKNNSTTTPLTVTAGTTIYAFEELYAAYLPPIRTGFTFVGWASSSIGTTALESSYTILPAANYYAVWTAETNGSASTNITNTTTTAVVVTVFVINTSTAASEVDIATTNDGEKLVLMSDSKYIKKTDGTTGTSVLTTQIFTAETKTSNLSLGQKIKVFDTEYIVIAVIGNGEYELIPADTFTGTLTFTESQILFFNAAAAAQDAAAAAAEAADAATAAAQDAADAAAEAADAATAAAQDAADAVAALSAEVVTLIAGLKKQITALTNLVIKIQKKVKA